MRKIIFLSTFLLTSVFCAAQDEITPNTPLSERITFGGDFGLSFGTITYVNISPLVGYRFTDHFTGGTGFIYQYINYSPAVFGYELQSSTYGGRLFGRYRFLENFFGTMELQGLNVDAYNLRYERTGRATIPVMLLGGGYLTEIGDRSFFSLSVTYDIIQDFNSPYYKRPVFQAGVIFNP